MSEVLEITHSESIPELFYSDKKKEPFTECSMCNMVFAETDNVYLIEKAYERDKESGKRNLVFELACCMNCRDEINNSLSKESKDRIAAYFAEHTDIETRDKNLKKHDLIDTEIWLNNCIVKNKSMDEVDEFQIYALCWKDEMVFHQFPYMICGEAMEEVAELLSNKSLDELNDLLSDLIDLPPELSELFKTGKKVFI